MPIIYCKIELKLKWTRYCALSVIGNDNVSDNDNIIFTIKDTRLYFPVVNLLARDKQKL